MAEYVVPVSFTYTAKFLVEADNPQQACVEVMAGNIRLPKVWAGNDLVASNADTTHREWNGVTILSDKVVALEVSPKRKRKSKFDDPGDEGPDEPFYGDGK